MAKIHVTLPAFVEKDIQRFWSKVKIGQPDQCWEWQGCREKFGYGIFRVSPRNVYAHRAAYVLVNGIYDVSLCVLHTCDNPPCCNPGHLRLGTYTDNAMDRDQKGRQAKGERNGNYTKPENRPRGEKHGWRTKPQSIPRGHRHGTYTKPESRAMGERNRHAKLTKQMVIDIRKRSAAGVPGVVLAKEFNLSPSGISSIILRKTWKHI